MIQHLNVEYFNTPIFWNKIFISYAIHPVGIGNNNSRSRARGP